MMKLCRKGGSKSTLRYEESFVFGRNGSGVFAGVFACFLDFFSGFNNFLYFYRKLIGNMNLRQRL